jgi:phosphoribosylanthranilate isomerase
VTRVKICGVTRAEDARDAALLGADAVGLNFVPASPRCLSPEGARRIIDILPPFVAPVGVFVDYPNPEALEDFATSLGLEAVQLHGDESPDYCSVIRRVRVIKALGVGESFQVQNLARYRVSGFLLDAASPRARGGTGQTFDWSRAAGANAFGHIVVAGGLDAGNVGDAIGQLHPFAVDVSSGVESSTGLKDYDMMARFFEAVRRADMTSL